MPRDISSSSEDEANDRSPRSPVNPNETNKKPTRYQCPGNFAYFCHKPCSSTLTKSLKNNKNELWLIKAPADFNPECFSGVKVPLSGLQKLKVPAAESSSKTGSGPQIYSILASNHGTADLCLLTSDKKSSDSMVFGPAFSGLLNVCESYGDGSTNQVSHIIPAAPAPSIPPGLKRRFYHFGSKPLTAASVTESETDGATLGLSTLCPLGSKRFKEEMGQEEEGRKKKKKKKEKQIKAEREEESSEVVRVKVEPVAEIQDEVMTAVCLHEGDTLGEKRKKKKKKKDREREVVEEGMEPRVKVEEVKCEQIDNLYGDVVEGGKKRKKKKSKTDND